MQRERKGSATPAQVRDPAVPRTPSGLANLGARTPRTADGKPDLSGIWETESIRPCPKDGCFDMQVGDQFLDIGAGLKGGLPYQPWALALMNARKEQNGKDDQETFCLPSGVPRMHMHPTYRKYVQIPGLLIILSERNVSFRQVFLDGRPLPKDPQPSWNGYSVGRWEGDTLVVETIGFRDGLWLDRNGSPMSDAAKVIERFRRINYGNLEIEVTVDDPKAYTSPWTTKLNQFIVVDTDLLDYVCQENEHSLPHLVGK
jgi:hypothetical protein